jgi:hypothetical protein
MLGQSLMMDNFFNSYYSPSYEQNLQIPAAAYFGSSLMVSNAVYGSLNRESRLALKLHEAMRVFNRYLHADLSTKEIEVLVRYFMKKSRVEDGTLFESAKTKIINIQKVIPPDIYGKIKEQVQCFRAYADSILSPSSVYVSLAVAVLSDEKMEKCIDEKLMKQVKMKIVVPKMADEIGFEEKEITLDMLGYSNISQEFAVYAHTRTQYSRGIPLRYKFLLYLTTYYDQAEDQICLRNNECVKVGGNLENAADQMEKLMSKLQ